MNWLKLSESFNFAGSFLFLFWIIKLKILFSENTCTWVYFLYRPTVQYFLWKGFPVFLIDGFGGPFSFPDISFPHWFLLLFQILSFLNFFMLLVLLSFFLWLHVTHIPNVYIIKELFFKKNLYSYKYIILSILIRCIHEKNFLFVFWFSKNENSFFLSSIKL